MNLVKLSKEVSYALRHEPQEFGLVLDDEGFVLTQDLLDALNARRAQSANESAAQIQEITEADLREIIATSAKKRFEISGDKIRALYGHSVDKTVEKTPVKPPSVLYHGTTHEALPTILKDGLKPMGRQRVHLSIDTDTAVDVGSRRDKHPIILEVDSGRAYSDGVVFYAGNDKVWLADYIAPSYLRQLS